MVVAQTCGYGKVVFGEVRLFRKPSLVHEMANSDGRGRSEQLSVLR